MVNYGYDVFIGKIYKFESSTLYGNHLLGLDLLGKLLGKNSDKEIQIKKFS